MEVDAVWEQQLKQTKRMKLLIHVHNHEYTIVGNAYSKVIDTGSWLTPSLPAAALRTMGVSSPHRLRNDLENTQIENRI